MAAAPVVDGKDNDADGKACNVIVKSEAADGDYEAPQRAVPAGGDPVVTFGSLGGRFADDAHFPEDEHGDSTDCSSSFGDSCSVSDDDVESDTCAMEVDSLFPSHIDVDDATEMPHLLRKKKVTAKWRECIGPVIWRCQWLELRMKDLLSQVAKYDKELALINHEKDLQLEMIKADSPKSGLPQLDLQRRERNTMKRRKRKRDEDVLDTLLYTEKHLILSYYNEKQKKKTETDELLDNDDVNILAAENAKNCLGMNDALTLLELKENDTVLEQYSLRDILLSIDGTQSRVVGLQNQLSEALNIDHSQKTRKAQKKKKLNSFHGKKDAGAVDITQPDEDEITVEMLFGADNPLIDARIIGLYKESTDDVLIDNQIAREEGYWQFERVNHTAEPRAELVKNVAESLFSKEQKTNVLVPHAFASRPPPIVTLVNKRGPKPKKKKDNSLPLTEDQIKRNDNIHTKKKKKEEDLNNPNIERTMLVAVDTRRSQRVRKPKVLN